MCVLNRRSDGRTMQRQCNWQYAVNLYKKANTIFLFWSWSKKQGCVLYTEIYGTNNIPRLIFMSRENPHKINTNKNEIVFKYFMLARA